MKSNQPTLAVNANDMEDEIFADLAMRFANRPLYRYSFRLEDTGMEVLLKQFADKICRVYRWRNRAGVRATEAVLRFDEFAFVFIQNRYYKHVRIF